jgi:multisubunit Na+/H+ antiporter MnhE subunit
MRRLWAWLSWWVLLAAIWLLLVDTVKLPELLAGAGAALVATGVTELIEEEGRRGLRPRLRWVRRLPVALARLPLDSAVVTRALFGGRPSGSFRVIRFRGGGDDPESTARRVVAKGLDSLGPNSYVVGIDEDRDLMLVHQLVPPDDPASADPMELR